jgi:hypothetical protein
MIFVKIRKSWTHAGSTPLLRALLLHGAAYYFVLALAFALQIVASMNNKVSGNHFLAFNRALPVGYSFTILWWTPSVWQCLAVTPYPDRTNSLAICVGVVSCNHLILSLREGVHGRPTWTEPTTFSRRTTGVAFAAQASNATSSYDDQLQTISLPKPTDRNHKQRNLTWHEMRPSRGSTANSLELK